MDALEHNLCLLNMSVIVLDKILANIHNRSYVSRTCKYLYEIVCVMERRRRVLVIVDINAKSILNIDADAVFDSILNSQRTIKEIELRFVGKLFPSFELNGRQLERLIVIMKQFGANVTSLKLQGFLLPINFIVELLQQAPKLESLSFTYGKVTRSVTENTTMSIQLPSLKALDINNFPGIFEIVNLIPSGSLTSYSGVLYRNDQSKEVLPTILTKQKTIQSLTLEIYPNSDITPLYVDHLQLDSLTFDVHAFSNDELFLDILKCHTNLKELRFINSCCKLDGSLVRWICNNLKKLEVFEVRGIRSTDGNPFELLGELKKLRHFRTSDANYLFANGFQSSQFASDSIEKLEFGTLTDFHCGELLNVVVTSMVYNLPNLTHLQMKFGNFSALCFVLRHCPQIIHLSSYVMDPIPNQLTGQRFPNVRSLELRNFTSTSYETLSQSMTSIARAMPNLKSMSLSMKIECKKFDVNTMAEFVQESKSLKYFYVDHFVIHRNLLADDVVETIRCLVDELEGYHISFTASTSSMNMNCQKIKENLSNEFYVPNAHWNISSFHLHKGDEKKYRTHF